MGNSTLTLNLLTTTIVAPPSNASKWQMGFNSAFKGLNHSIHPSGATMLNFTPTGRPPTNDTGESLRNPHLD